jgi:hypothetical protein
MSSPSRSKNRSSGIRMSRPLLVERLAAWIDPRPAPTGQTFCAKPKTKRLPECTPAAPVH